MRLNDEKKSLKDILKEAEIMPLRDFHIVQNEIDIELKEGVSVPVPPKFLKNLVREGVIKKIPKS